MSRHKPASSHKSPSDTPPLALAALVGDVHHFATSIWGQRARRVTGDPRLSDLLGIEVVDSLLASGLRRPHFRVICDGVTLPAQDVTRRVRTGGTTVDDFADPDRIVALLSDGATLVLQGLEHIRPQLADFSAELTAELGHNVQANAYLSPPRSAGLAAHTDTHDVFAVQLFGRKLWSVDGLDEAATEIGEVLYIPAGVRHAARTVDSWSLHLTIGVHAISVGTALRRAVERVVATEPSFRRPLPIAFASAGRDCATSQIRDARMDLIALLSALDIDAVVDATAASARRGSTSHVSLGTGGRLASLVASPQLTVSSTVVASVSATIRSSGHDTIEVAGGRRTLTMPARVKTAVEHLLAGQPCRVGDVPGLDDASRVVLVRRFLAEGLVTSRATTENPKPT